MTPDRVPLVLTAALADGWLAAQLLAVDPDLGGLVVTGPPGCGKSALLEAAAALHPGAATVRCPAGAAAEAAAALADRARGGVLLAESLHLVPPAAQRGLRPADHVLLAGCLAAAGSVDPGLLERCAFRVDLAGPSPAADRAAVLAVHHQSPDAGVRAAVTPAPDWAAMAAARPLLAQVRWPETQRTGLAGAVLALGIASLRADLLAGRAAAAHAALCGRRTVTDADLAVAVRLVLAPRRRESPVTPAAPPAADPSPTDPAPAAAAAPTAAATPGDPPPPAAAASDRSPPPETPPPPQPVAMPDLLAGLLAAAVGRSGGAYGTPLRAVRGRVGPWRVAVGATVRAAVPWQRLRGETAPPLRVTAADLHVRLARAPARELVLLLADGSGSMADRPFRRAKGALLALLHEAYRRRAHVALAVCQGGAARMLLSPGRGVGRVRRALLGLPAGGGTPLAAGLSLALDLALRSRQRGFDRVALVLVTDGRANRPVAPPPPGTPGSAWVERELADIGRQLRAAGVQTLVLDPRPRHLAGGTSLRLAGLLGAPWLSV